MKFKEKQILWSQPTYVGKKNGIEITVDRSERGWYFYGGNYNSLRSDVGAFETIEEAFEAAEKWCVLQKKPKGINRLNPLNEVEAAGKINYFLSMNGGEQNESS